jgi:DNA gyrase/topoisomerase IV subunit A
MSFIRINVTGLDESKAKINQLINELPNTNQRILQRTGEFMVDELKRNAHVVTGRMKASVRLESVTNKIATVAVPVPYADIENRRSGFKGALGPHNFADRAQTATIAKMPDIMRVEYDRLISSL